MGRVSPTCTVWTLFLNLAFKAGASRVNQAFRYEADMHTSRCISSQGINLRLKKYPSRRRIPQETPINGS